MVVFSTLRLGPTPELYALATVIVAVVTVLMLAAAWVQRGRLPQ
jgi:putrescine transport system permease protein